MDAAKYAVKQHGHWIEYIIFLLLDHLRNIFYVEFFFAGRSPVDSRKNRKHSKISKYRFRYLYLRFDIDIWFDISLYLYSYRILPNPSLNRNHFFYFCYLSISL